MTTWFGQGLGPWGPTEHPGEVRKSEVWVIRVVVSWSPGLKILRFRGDSRVRALGVLSTQ